MAAEIVKGAFSGKPISNRSYGKININDAWEKVTHPVTLAEYNYNSATGYKQWNRAAGAQDKPKKKQSHAPTLPPGWEVLLDNNGREFFYCVTSGETSLKMPSSEGEKLTDPVTVKHRFRCAKHRK